MIKIIFTSLGSFFLLVLAYLVFMYFFMKPAKPIMEYEFSNITYPELENKIYTFKTDEKFKGFFELKTPNNSKSSFTRFVVLGKDSLRYDFITQSDEDYKFKTEKRHSKYDKPWIELLGVADYSKKKGLGINYKNKDKHSDVIKLFEDEFIKKINNGEVDVIERGFWDWF